MKLKLRDHYYKLNRPWSRDVVAHGEEEEAVEVAEEAEVQGEADREDHAPALDPKRCRLVEAIKDHKDNPTSLSGLDLYHNNESNEIKLIISKLYFRVLVASEMVGAIIGRQGGTIRQITQQTRARYDELFVPFAIAGFFF